MLSKYIQNQLMPKKPKTVVILAKARSELLKEYKGLFRTTDSPSSFHIEKPIDLRINTSYRRTNETNERKNNVVSTIHVDMKKMENKDQTNTVIV